MTRTLARTTPLGIFHGDTEMTEQASVNIPKDLLEPIIRQHVAAGVVAAIGDPAELIRQIVDRSLKVKVDSEGKVNDYSHYNTHDFIDAIAGKTIREATKAAVIEYVNEQRPAIQAAVKAHLTRKTSAVAKALVDGLIESTSQRWDMKCEFVAKREER